MAMFLRVLADFFNMLLGYRADNRRFPAGDISDAVNFTRFSVGLFTVFVMLIGCLGLPLIIFSLCIYIIW
jgi:hypothetical protein